MLIRNGRSTRFWLDEWAKCGPLRGCIEGPLAPTDSSLRVCDVWVANDWDFSRISFVLPSEILDCIRNTSLSWFSAANDIRVWKHSTDGQFCSNSAYLLAKEFHPYPPITNWSWVWAICANPCILHFVWRVLHLKLNTKTHLFHR
ncbi:putative ribonuclease H protein [Camellia lanceoleosa]|uniref:Ribonuclease H protein n=1 Tax=Camellia lanceoleosa TaxID=1840588 RepID=A0ACC0FCK9_9ERIC|nr:putative ribonuclease H protein [Camellia lanceoleosa]